MNERKLSTIIFYDEKKRFLLQNKVGISNFGEEWDAFSWFVNGRERPKNVLMSNIRTELKEDIKDFQFFRKYDVDLSWGGETGHFVVNVYISRFPGFDKFNQQEGSHGLRLFEFQETLNYIKSRRIFPFYENIFGDILQYLSV